MIAGLTRETMKALCQMGKKVHMNSPNRDVRSVFSECPCTRCVDGGIDMEHCSECDRSNGFRYFNRKAK